MKTTTSIFPVHGLASLILMSKYAQSRQFFVGFPGPVFTNMDQAERKISSRSDQDQGQWLS